MAVFFPTPEMERSLW